MDEEQLQAWRRTRLEALANKLGGKAQLGRKLGYVDGAFVGQMISGVRPITEKTVRAAEALQGCRGWFSFLPPDEMPPPADKYAQLLRDLEDIPPGRRHRLMNEIQEAAEEAREAAAHFATRDRAAATQPAATSTASDFPAMTEDEERRVAALRKGATVSTDSSSKRRS